MKKIRNGLRAIWRGLAASFRWLGKWAIRGLRSLKSGRVLLSIAALVVAFGIGIAVSQAWSSDSPKSTTPSSSPSSSESGSQPSSSDSESNSQPSSGNPPDTPPEASSASEPNREPDPDNLRESDDAAPTGPQPTPAPVFAVLHQEPQTYQEAAEDAARLSADIVWPSDCISPLPYPDLLPNSPRAYRSGIHQGVDFMCYERGRYAVAALDGRAVVVVGDYEDPEADDRDQLLDVAAQLDATPPYTLLTLYGNYVVIDHGVIPDVGHVVTIYAHLEEVDPAVRVGETVQAGQRVGEIGNRGTHAAATGDFYTDPHLHWELHIDNQYLGAGLTAQETRHVYTYLFAEAS